MAWNEVANLRGPGMEYRGNYSSGTNYTPGDVVYYSYSTWVAKVPTRGVAPSTSGTGAANWGQVAARGATGAQGATGPVGAPGPQGPPGTAAPKYYGFLRWSGPWYNPIGDRFTRLKRDSDGRLFAFKDSGNVANTSTNDAHLYIPVSGIWQLSATQTWGNGPANKGVGLGRSLNDGAAGMELWRDFNGYGHGIASRATYLEAGARLYPWTWNGPNSGMSPADRGLYSEYSAVLLHLE